MLSNYLTPIVVSALLVSPAFNASADTNQCEGSSTMTVEKQEAMPVSSSEGHLLLLTQDSGPVTSTGIFTSGTATDQNIHQLYQGNGHGHGFYTINTDEGNIVAKWEGYVKTVMAEGQPNISFKGKWEFASGTGKFNNIKGNGVYDGYFTSANTRVVNWKGLCILAQN